MLMSWQDSNTEEADEADGSADSVANTEDADATASAAEEGAEAEDVGADVAVEAAGGADAADVLWPIFFVML